MFAPAFALMSLAAVAGVWFVVRSTLDVLPSLPRDNNDFVFL